MFAHEKTDAKEFDEAKVRDVEMSKLLTKIDERLDRDHENYILKEYEPIRDLYKGTISVSSFIVGFGGLVIAICSIGAGIYWVISHVK